MGLLGVCLGVLGRCNGVANQLLGNCWGVCVVAMALYVNNLNLNHILPLKSYYCDRFIKQSMLKWLKKVKNVNGPC